MDVPALEISVLGQFDVRVDRKSVSVAGRPRSLLGMLVLRANDVVPTDAIVDALWPGGTTPGRPRTAVHGYISVLRKLLGEDAIETVGSGYMLRIPRDRIDAYTFVDGVAEARTQLAAGNARAAKTSLDRLLSMWRGSALVEFRYEDWAQAEVERLEDLRLGALEERVDADLALGGHDALISELRSLVRTHPTRERFRRQLMLALYRAGRQAEALEAYGRAREELVETLGIEPGRDLRALYRAILNQDRGLDAPEATRTAVEVRAPLPPTPLVGRGAEFDEIHTLLSRADVRLVTLTGPGGVGKTRLALEAAHAEASRYTSVVFLDLSSIDDPVHAVTLVERATDSDARDGARQLLILDNLEQVIGVASRLAELLATVPGLQILATSREPLRVRAEHRLGISPLPLAAAVDLFLERANAVDPTEDLIHDATIEEICSRVDCLPLALELAAARSDLFSPKELLDGLVAGLAVLDSTLRDLPDRQRSLSATIRWSYDLLTPAHRDAFRRLGVSSGGMPVAVVEDVCGATRADIAALGAVNLVRVVDERVVLLETIAAYAAEQLATSSDAPEVYERHLEWVIGLAESTESSLADEAPPELLDRLDAEQANIVAAIERADPERRLRICGAIWRFWLIRGHIPTGRALLEAALQERRGVDPAVLRKAVHGAAILASRQDDLETARRYGEQDLEIAESLGDPEQIARACSNLGTIAGAAGRYDEARERYEGAAVIAAQAGFHRILATVRSNLVALAIQRHDYEAAAALGAPALESSRVNGDVPSHAIAAINLAEAFVRLGRGDEALDPIRESLGISQRIGDVEGVAFTLDLLGQLQAWRGASRSSARLLGAAAAMFANAGVAAHAEEQGRRDEAIDRIRCLAGEEAVEAWWAEGAALPLTEAVAEALAATFKSERSSGNPASI